MKTKFTAYNPTRLHFGAGVVEKIGQSALAYGKRVLLVYGQGSVVRNGYYNAVKESLEKAGCQLSEYNGIRPNPHVSNANEAIALGRAQKAELIVALGGGSVIDSAKIIAIGIADGVDAWDIMKQQHAPQAALPLLAVLTVAATGTEMNAAAVLQNPETLEKIGYVHPLIYPKESFLDPSYTLTVPKTQTAYGIVDLVAHTLENYFGAGNAPLANQMAYGLLKETLSFGPALLANLQNFDLRARMMWAATMALNGWLAYGKGPGDWGVHGVGHHMSLLFDTPHGASLSVVYPAWLRLMAERAEGLILPLGKEVFGVTGTEATIEALTAFFRQLGSPVSMAELGLNNTQQHQLLELMQEQHTSGYIHMLSANDRVKLWELMR